MAAIKSLETEAPGERGGRVVIDSDGSDFFLQMMSSRRPYHNERPSLA